MVKDGESQVKRCLRGRQAQVALQGREKRMKNDLEKKIPRPSRKAFRNFGESEKPWRQKPT
jgi:hypothetical protein